MLCYASNSVAILVPGFTQPNGSIVGVRPRRRLAMKWSPAAAPLSDEVVVAAPAAMPTLTLDGHDASAPLAIADKEKASEPSTTRKRKLAFPPFMPMARCDDCGRPAAPPPPPPPCSDVVLPPWRKLPPPVPPPAPTLMPRRKLPPPPVPTLTLDGHDCVILLIDGWVWASAKIRRKAAQNFFKKRAAAAWANYRWVCIKTGNDKCWKFMKTQCYVS